MTFAISAAPNRSTQKINPPATKYPMGYQIDKDRYLEVTKDELENIALESTRTIEQVSVRTSLGFNAALCSEEIDQETARK